MLNTYITINKW